MSFFPRRQRNVPRIITHALCPLSCSLIPVKQWSHCCCIFLNCLSGGPRVSPVLVLYNDYILFNDFCFWLFLAMTSNATKHAIIQWAKYVLKLLLLDVTSILRLVVNKQLLDEVFVISRIIKVKVRAMHCGQTWHDKKPVTLSVLDMIIEQSAVMTSQVLISKIHCTLSVNQKRVREFNA